MKRRKHLVPLLVIVLVATAGIGSGAGVDTETTNTAETSEIVDGTVVVYGGGAITDSDLVVTVASTDGAVRVVEDAGTGSETVRDTISVSTLNNTYSDPGNDIYYYQLNATDLISSTAVRSGEETNLTLQVIDNATVQKSNWISTNVTLTVEGEVGYSYYRFDTDHYEDSDSDSFTTTSAGDRFLADSPSTELETENVGMNGANSTLTLELANATSRAALNESLSSAEGEWVKSVTIDTSQGSIRAYTDLPDGFDTTQSYALIDNETGTVTIHFGEGFEGRSSVENVEVAANKGWLDQFVTYGFKLFGDF